MKIGILGCGTIAHMMVKTVAGMDDAKIVAISARDLERANSFAKQYDIPKAFGSYEEMLKDDEIELVYVATPHSHHFEHMKLCIQYKKPILCEKAFTMNAAQAREIKRLAKEANVYVCEAIWTRYMPSRAIINDLIDSGIIGKIQMINCNLAYNNPGRERLFSPELCGGALLDLGVYGLNFIIMHHGKNFEKVSSTVVMSDSGVDAHECINLVYDDKCLAVSSHSVYGRSDRRGVFYGENGYITVDNINNPQVIEAFDRDDNLLKHIDVPKQITGYEYEVIESMECIKQGLIESKSMPLDETIYMMELMDDLRRDWGYKFPMED